MCLTVLTINFSNFSFASFLRNVIYNIMDLKIEIIYPVLILVFLFLHCITYAPRFTHCFPGRSPFYLDKGKGVLEGTSDRDISCLTRKSSPGELQPQTQPFLKSPHSSGPLWACTCSAGGPALLDGVPSHAFPAVSPRPASLQMHCLVEKVPAARTAAWMFHHPLSVHLVSCLLPLSSSTYWGWITVLHYFPCPHGPRTYGYLVLIAR